jgi:hypothetical protein
MMKNILVVSLVMAVLASTNSFAMGRKNPMDPPQGPLPTECKAVESSPVGVFDRNQTTNYQAHWDPGACVGIVDHFGHNDCGVFYRPAHGECLRTTVEMTVADSELQLHAEQFARSQGFPVDSEHVVKFFLNGWQNKQYPTAYPACGLYIQKQNINVEVGLQGPDLKKARCNKLSECISTMKDEDSVILVQQWQHAFSCESAAK